MVIQHMSNIYGIPVEVENRIRLRDTFCVYCHKSMTVPSSAIGDRGDWATIEHFDNDGPLNEEWNIGICCWACNSSKGVVRIVDWFNSDYCKNRGINELSVAVPVKVYLKK